MAKILDYYNIELFIDNKEVNFSTPDFSFVMIDDINEIYNTATLEIPDNSGLLQEFLATVQGVPVRINYGDDETTLKGDYVIRGDKLEDLDASGILAGIVNLSLINSLYTKQEIISKAHQDRISYIIKRIANKYNYSQEKQIINDTGNEDIWYQSLVTDIEFIQEYLLPYAYSNDSGKTPFYFFLGSDGTFNFRSYQRMLKQNPVEELEYKQEAEENTSRTIIRDVQRFRGGSDVNRKTIGRLLFSISLEDGSLIEDEDSIINYPAKENNYIPIYNGENLYSYFEVYKEGETKGKEENNLGEQISSIKDSMHIDSFILYLPFTPSLLAGKMVNITFYTYKPDMTVTAISQFSGDYLVKRSEQIWIGSEQKGMSKLLVTRKYTKLSSDFTLKENLI